MPVGCAACWAPCSAATKPDYCSTRSLISRLGAKLSREASNVAGPVFLNAPSQHNDNKLSGLSLSRVSLKWPIGPLPVVRRPEHEVHLIALQILAVRALLIELRDPRADRCLRRGIETIVLRVMPILVGQIAEAEEELAGHWLVAVLDHNRFTGGKDLVPPVARLRDPMGVSFVAVHLHKSGRGQRFLRGLRKTADPVDQFRARDVDRKPRCLHLRRYILVIQHRAFVRGGFDSLAVHSQREAHEIRRLVHRRAQRLVPELAHVDVRHRERDDGPDIRVAVVHELVAHAHFSRRDVQILRRHADIRLLREHQPARCKRGGRIICECRCRCGHCQRGQCADDFHENPHSQSTDARTTSPHTSYSANAGHPDGV